MSSFHFSEKWTKQKVWLALYGLNQVCLYSRYRTSNIDNNRVESISYNSLRKHAYSNILKNLAPKNENFQIKNSYIFHISAQIIDCGYSLERGSNEYPQSMISSRNKKNNVYPCKPQFYYIKVGFEGVKIF